MANLQAILQAIAQQRQLNAGRRSDAMGTLRWGVEELGKGIAGRRGREHETALEESRQGLERELQTERLDVTQDVANKDRAQARLLALGDADLGILGEYERQGAAQQDLAVTRREEEEKLRTHQAKIDTAATQLAQMHERGMIDAKGYQDRVTQWQQIQADSKRLMAQLASTENMASLDRQQKDDLQAELNDLTERMAKAQRELEELLELGGTRSDGEKVGNRDERAAKAQRGLAQDLQTDADARLVKIYGGPGESLKIAIAESAKVAEAAKAEGQKAYTEWLVTTDDGRAYLDHQLELAAAGRASQNIDVDNKDSVIEAAVRVLETFQGPDWWDANDRPVDRAEMREKFESLARMDSPELAEGMMAVFDIIVREGKIEEEGPPRIPDDAGLPTEFPLQGAWNPRNAIEGGMHVGPGGQMYEADYQGEEADMVEFIKGIMAGGEHPQKEGQLIKAHTDLSMMGELPETGTWKSHPSLSKIRALLELLGYQTPTEGPVEEPLPAEPVELSAGAKTTLERLRAEREAQEAAAERRRRVQVP